jgi:hypothetical protein
MDCRIANNFLRRTNMTNTNENQPAYPHIELNEHTTAILGMICLRCGPIAQMMREAKFAAIKRRAEEEQAFVICWLLNIYFEHGEKWQDIANVKLQEIATSASATLAELEKEKP